MRDEPPFDENGNLPPGIYEFEWQEFATLFGWNGWRRELLSGMLDALRHLDRIGCRRVYIDGSFVTSKEVPGDYDGCWERAGMTLSLLDPILQQPFSNRYQQKAKYRGEWFPAELTADLAGTAFIEFFQMDRSGNLKGIVAIDLGGLP